MEQRRGAPRAVPGRYGQKGRPLKPPPPAASRPPAHVTAEARGWEPITRRGMQRVLVTLLARHRDGDTVAASAVHEVASLHSISTHGAIEILAAMGILTDDRPDLFTSCHLGEEALSGQR